MLADYGLTVDQVLVSIECWLYIDQYVDRLLIKISNKNMDQHLTVNAWQVVCYTLVSCFNIFQQLICNIICYLYDCYQPQVKSMNFE